MLKHCFFLCKPKTPATFLSVQAQQWQMALLLLSDHPDPSVVSFNAALSAVTGNMAGQLSGAMKLVSTDAQRWLRR